MFRLGLEKEVHSLTALLDAIPGRAVVAKDEKDASEEKARRHGALRDSLARYSCKVSCDWLLYCRFM